MTTMITNNKKQQQCVDITAQDHISAEEHLLLIALNGSARTTTQALRLKR
jgi:hypothetical protein